MSNLASMVTQTAGVVFVAGVCLAVMSGIVGICLACTKRPNKRGEALLFGIGLPIVFLGIAFAGCAAAFS
jgi:hypothetical protein